MLQKIISLMMRGAIGSFWLILWVFSLGVVIHYVLRWWPGDRLFTVRLTNYIMPWLLMALVPVLVLALIAHRRWLMLSLAIPTLLISFSYIPLFLPRTSLALAGDEPLKVMSYNVWRRNQTPDQITAVIRAEKPDIILLQETNSLLIRNLSRELADDYPEGVLYFVHSSGLQQSVISRYPLSELDADRAKGRAQKVLVETPEGAITVWNVHTFSGRWRIRYHQIKNLVNQDIATAAGPVIVGGDFNTTDQTEAYHLLTRYLHNAHWEAGWGFGFSFPSTNRRISRELGLPSLVRIDHIFYNDHFYVRQAATLPEAGGSDHYPVVATLSWVK